MVSRSAVLLLLAGLPVWPQSPEVNPVDGLTYIRIPAGTFLMGCSPADTDCAADEKPSHQVTIGKAFRIGQTPVTQEAYQRVTGKTPGYFKGAKFPVESISWDEAQSYCQATGMRLPTEAEWEFAARAGAKTSRTGELEQSAWSGVNSENKTHEVMQKQPNAWKLYDMLGNVWEWTADWYAPYPAGTASDPQGPESGKIRALRGGSWGNGPSFVRLSVRSANEPENRSNVVGFRCAGD